MPIVWEETTHPNGQVERRRVDTDYVSNAPRPISSEDFIERIPEAAWETITNSNNAKAVAFYARVSASPVINLDSPKVQNAVASMVSGGLISQAEADEILA